MSAIPLSAQIAFGAPRFIDLGASEIAYRVVGRGEPLLLVHGYPLHGMTFRKILPQLAARFTCYVPDLPGAGETRWTDRTDFTFGGQAETLERFTAALGLTSYSILAHDTGATIARRLTTNDIGKVARIVLIGTEIPNHRPPWIETFQRTANPRQTFVFQTLMKQRWFRRSSAAFGGVFTDKSLIDGEFFSLFIAPLIESKTRASGQIRYLRGIDWTVVDGMATEHSKITVPSLLIWGEDDPVFPVRYARAMAAQLPDCRGFVTVPGAKTFVHEEKPDEVARIALAFLTDAAFAAGATP